MWKNSSLFDFRTFDFKIIDIEYAENEEGVEDEIIMCNYKCEQEAIDAIEEETGKNIISWDFEWKYHGCSGRYCRKLNCADE